MRELIELFGKNGEYFWNLAHGIDERTVETEREAKSVSNEVTFEEDTGDDERVKGALMQLSEKVSGRLRQEGLKGRTITLKIRLEGFHTYTRAVTVGTPTNYADILYKERKKAYNSFDSKGKKVRLVGVKVSNLSPTNLARGRHFSDGGSRRDLFDASTDRKREDLHRAVDKIKEKFGDTRIHRARSTMT